MVNEKDIAKGISGILIVLLLIGSLSPYLFPDRRRTITVIQYISIPHDYINLNVSIPNDFEVNLQNNLNNDSNIYEGAKFDKFNNKNTTSITYYAGYNAKLYQAFFIPRNGNLTGILTFFKSTSVGTAPNLNFTIWNASFDSVNNRYKPDKWYKNTNKNWSIAGGKYSTVNITDMNIPLDITKTEGNTFFIEYKCINEVGIARIQYNTTLLNTNCFQDPETGTINYVSTNFKANYTIVLDNFVTSNLENENAKITSVIIGGENRTNSVLGIESYIHSFNIYNLENDGINGSDYFYTLVTNNSNDVPLNIIEIKGDVGFLDELLFSISYTNTLFNGTNQFIFQTNSTYNIVIDEIDIILISPIDEYFEFTWNARMMLHLTINGNNNDVTINFPNFSYLF